MCCWFRFPEGQQPIGFFNCCSTVKSPCVTTDILLEYEEIIARLMGPEFANEVLEILFDLDNLIRIERFFYWNLLEKDPDDNKFIDCAIAASADVLVSEDRVFRKLKQIKFPQVTCMRIDEFAALFGV
jgi:predicted nucleic acid-binding protein